MSYPRRDVQPLYWQQGALHVLDQRALPARENRLRIDSVAGVADAIRSMMIRGAPAIGIAAAYGVALSGCMHAGKPVSAQQQAIAADMRLLAAARPTAINLSWALARMRRVLESQPPQLVEMLLQEAQAIHQEDLEQNRRMAELGSSLVLSGSAVLTHCNTGSLATGGYGTALGVIRSAFRAGHLRGIFATETRPWLQGARLTAWELSRDDIPVTLIADSAAAAVMQRERINWVIVGADRIAANGDVANKIGTYALALAARHHGARFMVVAPFNTVDMQLASGADIPIEYRDGEELWKTAGFEQPPAGVEVLNPVFDVTPAAFVDVLVTERGVIPKSELRKMMDAAASTR